jgi:hypothetical protein
MTIAQTDLRTTRERARELRFEPAGSIRATNVQKAIEAMQQVAGTSVTVVMSPYTPTTADTVLYVDTSGGPITILLQASADRNGMPLSIKDVTGNAAANNITVKPSGAETIDLTYTNAAPLVIAGDFGGYRLNPRTLSYTLAP